VPESKLARKREERLRKTAEKEERERSSDSRLGIGAPGISPGIRVAHNLTPTSYSSLHDRMELDRMEKEKREREMAELRDRENRSESHYDTVVRYLLSGKHAPPPGGGGDAILSGNVLKREVTIRYACQDKQGCSVEIHPDTSTLWNHFQQSAPPRMRGANKMAKEM
jgi:hypothetical protein